MRALAGLPALVDLERVAGNDPQAVVIFGFEFGQRGQAAAIALDRHYLGTAIEQCAGKATRARPDFIDRGAIERPGNGGDSRQQLPVEDKILAERLGRLQTMPRDHLAQWLGRADHVPQDLR